MRGFLIFLGGLIVLVVAAVVLVPMFVSGEEVKQRIEAAVEEATGRQLTIAGDVKISVLPTLSANIGQVTFANAPGAQEANMAQMAELEAELQILPLLSGEVRVERFVLKEPVIHLEIARDGTANWQFERGTVSEAPAAETPAQDETAGETGGGDESGGGVGFAARDVVLADIRVVDGTVSYRDAQTGDSYVLNDVDVTVSLPGLDAPFSMEGALTWNDERVNLNATLERTRAVLEGGETGAEVSVSSDPLTFDYQGTISRSEGIATSGTMSLDVPSVRGLAAWTGNPMPEGGGFGPLKLDGQIASSEDRYSFSNAKVSFDGMNGAGDLVITTSGARPKVTGQLSLDKLDINAYGGEGDADWSTEAIDVSALGTVDADLALTVGEIIAGSIVTGEGVLDLKLDNALMNATLKRLALYSGTGTGTLKLNGRGGTPSLATDLSLSGLQIEPFLQDAMDFERLRGTGAMKVAVTAQGNSQAAMVKTLNGNGSIDFRDGAIKGVNLAQIIRTALTDPISGWNKGTSQDTDFSELSGTFNITNGVLSNNDLQLLGPLLRLTGKGSTSIPAQTIDYRLNPKLVASLEGQGGDDELAGLNVPVKVTGTWSNPKFAPDLEALMQNPDAALKNLQNMEKLQPKDIMRGLLGQESGTSSGESTSDSSSEEEKPKSLDKMQPKDVLKGLFGNK